MSSDNINRPTKHKLFLREVSVPTLLGLCLIGATSLLFYGSLLLLIFFE